MTDEIIDIGRYLGRGSAGQLPPGTTALWGADGERSRFALPLWRIVHLAEADRGIILWRSSDEVGPARAFVVLDLLQEPARLELPANVAMCRPEGTAELHDLGPEGLVVCLGEQDARTWCLVADGREPDVGLLDAKKREDILFLAGECAGLLFSRDFAGLADGKGEG